MKKVIIGFTGENNVGKTLAANILKKEGFHVINIDSEIEKFATQFKLFSDDELGNEKSLIVKEMRDRGANICKEYWINLILSRMPDGKNLIVFDDVGVEEAININGKKIKIYQICRSDISSNKIENIKIINNDGTKEDLAKEIKKFVY